MTTTAIAEVVPKRHAELEGEIVSVTAHVTPPTYLNVELADESGTIKLLFQGCQEISGVRPGRRIRVAGTPLLMIELLLMVNPTYELSA